MGPRVVPANRGATRGATLNGKQQTVIAGRATAVEFNHVAIILSDLRILQTQPASLVGIGRRRACGVADAIERARTKAQKHGWIQLGSSLQVDRRTADVVTLSVASSFHFRIAGTIQVSGPLRHDEPGVAGP